jgi:hypothetical protein
MKKIPFPRVVRADFPNLSAARLQRVDTCRLAVYSKPQMSLSPEEGVKRAFSMI